MKGSPFQTAITKTARVRSSADADGVVTIAAIADEYHKILRIDWSYYGSATLPSSAAPGELEILNNASAIKVLHKIVAAGHDYIEFPNGLFPDDTDVNKQATVTIKAGGASVIGELTVQYQ